jgi:hypothetical protein
MECVVVLGCMRWAWKRCTYIGSDDSATWPLATPDEFEAVPRVCRMILAVYESDLRNPQWAPPGGYGLNPDWVVKRVTYEQTEGQAPPYLIYCDHEHRQIVLAIRGLNLAKESDYKLLMNNRLGMRMFDGGYVHHGLLNSAIWLLDQESETLRQLWVENGSCYEMVFAGHSLGSGVAALMTVVAVNHRDRLGGIPREKIRCYAVAPARCMSLNLAVKYADVIYSIVLQVWDFPCGCLLGVFSIDLMKLFVAYDSVDVGNYIFAVSGLGNAIFLAVVLVWLIVKLWLVLDVVGEILWLRVFVAKLIWLIGIFYSYAAFKKKKKIFFI